VLSRPACQPIGRLPPKPAPVHALGNVSAYLGSFRPSLRFLRLANWHGANSGLRRTFRRIGYARVSTVGQTLESQLEQLKAAGCEIIFKEKVTGTPADRKELMRLLKAIAPGDQLVVTRIDRLARSVGAIDASMPP